MNEEAIDVTDAIEETHGGLAVAVLEHPTAVITTPPATDDPSPSKRMPRAARWIMAGTLAVSVALGAVNNLGTHRRLSATRTHLQRTSAVLAATRSNLATTKATLASTQGDLATRTRERDEAQAQLNGTRSELSGVRQTLNDTQHRVELQAGQIDTLKTCLGGVSEALVDIANDNFDGAIAALNVVSTACQRAFKLF